MNHDFNFKIIVSTIRRIHTYIYIYIYARGGGLRTWHKTPHGINSPALEYLDFKGYLVEYVLLENLSNLVEAVVNVEPNLRLIDDIEDHGNWVCNLIKPVCHIEQLHLSRNTIMVKQVFSFSIIKFLKCSSWTSSNIFVVTCDCYVVVQCLCNAFEFDPPMFHNLSFLTVEGSYACHVLMLLLQQAPNLALLVFVKVSYVQMMRSKSWYMKKNVKVRF